MTPITRPRIPVLKKRNLVIVASLDGSRSYLSGIMGNQRKRLKVSYSTTTVDGQNPALPIIRNIP